MTTSTPTQFRWTEPIPETPGVGKLVLNLHEGQTRAWDSKKRYVVMLAGTQGGKTVFGVHWLEREIRRQGPGDYLAVTATFPLLELKMLPEFLHVFRDTLKLGKFLETKKVFMYHDGKTRIIFGSATNSESIESATAKAAWLDEAGQKQFKRDAWDAIQRRLSIHQGRVLITTTLYGLGWLKSELYDPGKAGDKDIDIIQYHSTLNPAFPVAEMERQRARLPAWKFAMFYKGEFEKPAGMIYDSFDTQICKIPRMPIPLTWPVYVGHDFGGSNPAAMFYAVDPTTGYIYAWAEYLPGSRSTDEHCKAFKALTNGRNVIKRVGGSHTEEGWRNDFTAHGWPIAEPKVLDVEVGISRVYGTHKLNKLFVFNDLVNYLDEKLSYSRVLDDNLVPTDVIEDKSKYHLMDSERYILSDFFPETADPVKAGQVWAF